MYGRVVRFVAKIAPKAVRHALFVHDWALKIAVKEIDNFQRWQHVLTVASLCHGLPHSGALVDFVRSCVDAGDAEVVVLILENVACSSSAAREDPRQPDPRLHRPSCCEYLVRGDPHRTARRLFHVVADAEQLEAVGEGFFRQHSFAHAEQLRSTSFYTGTARRFARTMERYLVNSAHASPPPTEKSPLAHRVYRNVHLLGKILECQQEGVC